MKKFFIEKKIQKNLNKYHKGISIFLTRYTPKKYKSGFTLVEMIVVLGIMATITAISLFNSSKLNSNVLLSNTAYEIGLVIRDAQVAGLGARVISSVDGAGKSTATTSNQGIHFDINKPEDVILFADIDKSNSYGLNEQSQVYSIENKRAGKILKICKFETQDGNNTCEEISNLDILFKRPNPEAYFYYNDGGGVPRVYVGNVAVNLGFVDGECRSIIVYKTGAIQIDKSLCSPIIN